MKKKMARFGAKNLLCYFESSTASRHLHNKQGIYTSIIFHSEEGQDSILRRVMRAGLVVRQCPGVVL